MNVRYVTLSRYKQVSLSPQFKYTQQSLGLYPSNINLHRFGTYI